MGDPFSPIQISDRYRNLISHSRGPLRRCGNISTRSDKNCRVCALVGGGYVLSYHHSKISQENTRDICKYYPHHRPEGSSRYLEFHALAVAPKYLLTVTALFDALLLARFFWRATTPTRLPSKRLFWRGR